MLLYEISQIADFLAHVIGINDVEAPAECAFEESAPHNLPVKQGPVRMQQFIECAGPPGFEFLPEIMLSAQFGVLVHGLGEMLDVAI